MFGGSQDGPSSGKLQALYSAEQGLMKLLPFLPDGSARRLSDLKAELRDLVLGAGDEEEESEMDESPRSPMMGFGPGQ